MVAPNHVRGDPSFAAAPIVVGVNGSSEALRAARWAGAVAERLQAPLRILTATPYVGHLPSDLAAVARVAAIEEHRESAELILKTAADAVRADRAELIVTAASVTEAAPQALDAASRTARLLVLACDDLTVAGAVLIGSTTLATLAHSTCPVVAWRGGVTSPTHQPIVVGVDGSAIDGGALGVAFELASRLDASLKVISCWPTHIVMPTLTGPPVIEWDSTTQAQWRHLNELLDPWRDTYPHVDVKLIFGPDKPGRALLLHSSGAQLLVIGSRRRDPLPGGLFGSTSMNLLHHSKVPVVLCPFDDDQDVKSASTDFPADGIACRPA
ncbi:MAG: universal stress protein [Mycobacterium sp.]